MSKMINQVGLEELIQMGIFSKYFKKNKDGEVDRREFLRGAGKVTRDVAGIAAISQMPSLMFPEEAKAKLGYPDRLKEMSGGIQSGGFVVELVPKEDDLPKYTSKDYANLHPALKDISLIEKNAWLAWKKDRSGGLTLKFLDLDPSLASDSSTYHLLRAQIKHGLSDSEINKIVSNPAKAEFAKGTKRIYTDNNDEAKNYLATGIFLSSSINSMGYNAISQRNMPNLKITGNKLKDAKNLAELFVKSPIQDKLFLLEVLKINDIKEFHWNNGLYIVSEIENKHTVKELLNSKVYKNNRDKLGYDSASNSLLFN